MKILAIHSDFIEFQAKKKAFKAAEEGISTDLQRVEECLVIFTAAEKNDEADEKTILSKYLNEIKDIATQVKATKIVLYPYAHLSSNLASPKFAEKIMKDAQKSLKEEKKYEIFRAPFGWYKSFNVACKGHPLSELSRNITIEDKKGYVGIVKDKLVFSLSDKKLSENEKQSASMALVMAVAIKELYPKAQFGRFDFHLGEAYADFANLKIKRGELNKISKKMQEILKQDLKFESANKAHNQFNKEIAKDLGKTANYIKLGEVIVVPTYKDAFVKSTKDLGVFSLKNLGSAYWRNNANNDQLTRIYLVAFKTQKELDNYEKERAKAEERSHLKIGKEQELFVISKLVGPGLPLLAPNGMIIRREIVKFLWELHEDKDYKWVWTPHIAKEALYKTSGHWDKFGDELFKVQGKVDKFILKPMNCPHHMQIFDSFSLSYRDMPVRFFEPATVYRDEKSGQLNGLARVRSITQDDGHLFCRQSQIVEEAGQIVTIINKFYSTIGMDDNYWVSLSVRGDDKSKYLGEDKVWDIAEKALEKAAKENKLPFKKIKGEAAFYGPKLDFMFKDALGREWQLATVQCDFNLPERFKLSYMNEVGKKERPVVIHRAITGALERFMAIVIEHFAGKFPLWLSPVQVKIMTVTDRNIPFAKQVHKKMQAAGIRSNLDDRAESIGKKVRDAQLQQANYMITIGDKEDDLKTLAVRTREGKVEFGLKVDKFVEKLQQEIAKRSY